MYIHVYENKFTYLHIYIYTIPYPSHPPPPKLQHLQVVLTPAAAALVSCKNVVVCLFFEFIFLVCLETCYLTLCRVPACVCLHLYICVLLYVCASVCVRACHCSCGQCVRVFARVHSSFAGITPFAVSSPPLKRKSLPPQRKKSLPPKK